MLEAVVLPTEGVTAERFLGVSARFELITTLWTLLVLDFLGLEISTGFNIFFLISLIFSLSIIGVMGLFLFFVGEITVPGVLVKLFGCLVILKLLAVLLALSISLSSPPFLFCYEE